LLGYARLKSGSILLPIFLHSFNNFVTSIITHLEVY
jgi:membrane protease YdiL (CAAX protease family)